MMRVLPGDLVSATAGAILRRGAPVHATPESGAWGAGVVRFSTHEEDARVDVAWGMREAASNAADDVYEDLHARGDSAEAMGASRAAEKVRALDPATVGSGS